MNTLNHNITYLIRLLTVVSVVFAMVIQPGMESLTYLGNQEIELVDIDTEKDSNENENQEKDSKDEKVELQILDFGYDCFPYSLLKDAQKLEFSLKDITRDIPIPPPDAA